MDSEPLYSAEQIKVPSELGAVIKQYTKDVIRGQPSNEELLRWSANYFARLAGLPEPFPILPPEAMAFLRQIFDAVDKDGSGTVEAAELLKAMQAEGPITLQEYRNTFEALDLNKDGMISFNEFVNGFIRAMQNSPPA